MWTVTGGRGRVEVDVTVDTPEGGVCGGGW